MAYDKQLAGRVRAQLADMGGASEMAMMGVLCFLRDGKMCCGVSGDRLMVRLGAEGAAGALTDPDVSVLEVGPGRAARGFVTVAARAVADENALAAWIARGVVFADSLPTRPQRRR